MWMAVTGTECRRKLLFHFLNQMREKSTAWGTDPTSPASLRGRERCLIPCFCTLKTWQRQYAKNRRYGQRCVCDISVLTGVCRGQECEWCRLIYVSDFFQVETMQRLKQKAEIQSLASIAPHFLTRVYLPNKLRYGGWIWASAALYWNMYAAHVVCFQMKNTVLCSYWMLDEQLCWITVTVDYELWA